MGRSAPRTHRLVVAGNYVVRCAITDLSGQRGLSPLDPRPSRKAQLREQVRRWAVDGVDIVQVREKQLESGERYDLAWAAIDELRKLPPVSVRPRLVLNGRPDIAAAVGADGVHLPSRPGELSPTQARAIFLAAGSPACLVSVSCHSPSEAALAHREGADFILFGPVFEKRVGGELLLPGTGLQRLAEACHLAAGTPVLALGGVTADTMEPCMAAGAAGVAGIRLFGA